MMGMVLGHIFTRVTKRVPAWERRLCFSNLAGRLCSTLLHSAQLTLPTWRKKLQKQFDFLLSTSPSTSHMHKEWREAGRKARKAK